MCSVLPKAEPSKKPPFCRSKVFSEQIEICFVYHPMKLLILALLAVAVLAAASGRDCFWQWQSRVQVREAREQAREFRREQRDQMRAFRDHMRAERDRIRREIREDMRDLHRDWRYTY
jgi:hypothetical protein